MLEVDDEEQRLGADEGGDDHPDQEVHDPVAVDAGGAGALHGEPQAQQVCRGEQHAVRINGDRTGVKQDWMHDVLTAHHFVNVLGRSYGTARTASTAPML